MSKATSLFSDSQPKQPKTGLILGVAAILLLAVFIALFLLLVSRARDRQQSALQPSPQQIALGLPDCVDCLTTIDQWTGAKYIIFYFSELPQSPVVLTKMEKVGTDNTRIPEPVTDEWYKRFRNLYESFKHTTPRELRTRFTKSA